MIPLAMIVLDELRDGVPEVPLTDGDDAIETFFLDRPHESFGVGVRVWRALRDQHHADARVSQPTPDIMAAFPIPITDQTCGSMTPGSAIVTVRTICCMKSASGCGVDPKICTRRDTRSIMKTV